jgi:hypothetical protein
MVRISFFRARSVCWTSFIIAYFHMHVAWL